MGSDDDQKPSGGDFWLGETVAASDSQPGEGRPFTPSPFPSPNTSPPPSPHAPQPRYEHYEILRREDGTLWELGRGAMGATYKAFDTRLHCVVALKVVHSALLDKFPILRERFLREARTAASLRHPNVAGVFHLGEQVGGPCFYAMEYIEGETLAERVRRRGRMPVLQALDIVTQINHALIAAEGEDLIHRDIKPGNVMLVDGGLTGSATAWPGDPRSPDAAPASPIGSELVKVIDFGLARPIKPDAGSPLTAVGDFVGTPHYASPEQLAGDEDDPLDIRSDIFSLGLTFWYLLTAQHPFAGNTLDEIQRRQHRSLPVAQLEASEVPPPVIDLLRVMLAKDPDKRPQSATLLAERLGRCRRQVLALAGLGTTLVVPGTAVPPPAPPPRTLLIVLRTLGFFILGIVGLIIWMLVSGHLHINEGSPSSAASSPASASPFPPPPSDFALPTSAFPLPTSDFRSLAVLPFDNRSDDPRNAYLADGIQDDLLASLAKIHALRVISRTSVESYRDRSTRANLREIARALHVGYVLEGSVQRIGERVHVTAHLIDARLDANVWAETYDRDLSDALTLQSEIAQKIAAALQATLSPEEKARVETKLTGNPDAYVLFLRGREFQNRLITLDSLRVAEGLYRQALALDPNFAVAYARLSQTLGRIAFNYEPSDEHYADVLANARRALALQPDLGEGHLALGCYFYWYKRAYDQSLAELAIAARALPNDAEILRIMGYVQRRQGRMDAARDSFQRAEKLGPRDTGTLEALARFYLNERDWPNAADAYDRAIQLATENANSQVLRGMVDFHWKGDLTRLRRALPGIISSDYHEGEVTVCRYDVAIFDEQYAEAERALDSTSHDTYATSLGTPLHREFLRGLLYRARHGDGDAARAQKAFETARPYYEDNVRRYPDDALRHVDLALLYAALGWRDAALGEGRYAAKMRPESVDVISGSTVTLRLARVYALLGDADDAMPLLEHLFTISVDEWNGFSKNDLRRRPEWSQLRSDPRFQRLIAKD